MSDEGAGNNSYSSRRHRSSRNSGRGSNAAVTGGAGTGARKADSPSAWMRVPTTRQDASDRARSQKKG